MMMLKMEHTLPLRMFIISLAALISSCTGSSSGTDFSPWNPGWELPLPQGHESRWEVTVDRSEGGRTNHHVVVEKNSGSRTVVDRMSPMPKVISAKRNMELLKIVAYYEVDKKVQRARLDVTPVAADRWILEIQSDFDDQPEWKCVVRIQPAADR